MTKVLVACDSFKDALDSIGVCTAIRRGLLAAEDQLNVQIFPLADGGEGMLDILSIHQKCHIQRYFVCNPLFEKVEAGLGISNFDQIAFIEMAAAAGLQLLSPEKRNPLRTTTFGVGELILKAQEKGMKKIIIGIGGSATNDCGIGMATALGFRFLDNQGAVLKPTGENLIKIASIDDSNIKFDKTKIEVEVICDVDNPLFGENGAAHVYAPQKGASKIEVDKLDAGLKHFSNILQDCFHKDFSSVPGGGAAGGMGAGCLAFLGATLKSGIETILEVLDFEEAAKGSDLIITGEGKIDHQTFHGKLISGLTQKAIKYNIPVIAFCGTLAANPLQTQELGLQAAFSILDKPVSLVEALESTEKGLEQLAFNVWKVFTNN